jgi:ribosome-associated protein
MQQRPRDIPPADPGGIELAPGVFAMPQGLQLQFVRSGGPGGQNVNKVSTKAQLSIGLADMRGLAPDAAQRLAKLAGSRLTLDGRIVISVEETRSQERNREIALQRLRELIVAAQRRPRKRRATRPTQASRRRRLEAKKHRAEVKAGRRTPH